MQNSDSPHNANPETPPEDLGKALHLAAAFGPDVFLRQVIAWGADLHWRAPDGSTALCVAAGVGNLSAVRILVEAGARLTAENTRQPDPLTWASLAGQQAAVEALFAVGAQVSSALQQSLPRIALQGHVSVLKALMRHGADLRAYAQSPLLEAAASEGQTEVVRLLVDLGFPLEGHPESPGTPLCAAIISGEVALARCLLDAGAQLEARTEAGATPLILAAALAQPDLLELFLQAGADLMARDSQGRTALDCAAENGYLDLVERLLAAGSPQEAALARAREYGPGAVQQLLECAHSGVAYAPTALPSLDRPAIDDWIIAPESAASPTHEAWMKEACRQQGPFARHLAQLPVPPQPKAAAGTSAVEFFPDMQFYLEGADPQDSDYSVVLAQLVRELFVGVYVFDQRPLLHLNVGSSAAPSLLVPPCYERTYVSQVLTDLAFLLRGYMTSTWLPHASRCQLPPQPPKSLQARRRQLERLGAVDVWQTAPEGDRVRAAAQQWQTATHEQGVSRSLVRLGGTPGVIRQHERAVLVYGNISVAAGAFDRRGIMPPEFEPTSKILRTALVSALPLPAAARPLMHWYQAIAFFTHLFDDLKARDLIPNVAALDVLPILRRRETGAAFAVPPAGVEKEQHLANAQVQVLVGEQPTQRTTLTPAQQHDLQRFKGLHGVLEGRHYARLDLEIARMDSGAREPSWLFDMRDRVNWGPTPSPE